MGAARPGRRGRTRRALVIGVVVALATGFAVTADLVRPSPPTAEAAVVLGRVANGVGKCLDNAGNATTANNRVQGNPCSTAPAQQWSRQGLTIRTPGNRCLEPLAGRTAVNTPVVAAACSTANSQQWQAIAGVLYNNRAQKCLQLQTTANAATAIVVGCNTRAAAQRWSLPAASTAGPPPAVPPPAVPPPAPTPPAATPPRVTTTVPPPAPVPVPTTTTPPPAVPTTTTAPAATSPAVPVVPTVVNGTTTMVPVPTTTTPPVPPPFQPQGSTVWAADLTKPDVVTAGFVNRSANRQLGDGVWNNPALPWPIRTEPAPAGRPGRSVPFTLPNDAIRLEVEPNHRVFVEGDVYYFGFAFHLGPDFPLDTTSWQVIEQLHGAPGTGSPPISFQAAKGGLLIDGGANKPGATSPGQFAYQKRLANLERGRWYNVVYRVVFSADPTKSWVDVWLDGQKVLENFQPPCATVYPSTAAGDRSGTYRKQGIYHYREIPGGTMSMAGQKLGTGYAAADPSR